MKILKRITIISLIIFSCWSISFAQPPADTMGHYLAFEKANTLYKENKYAEAAEEYEKIFSAGFHSGNLYYNLGNAYFKQGMLGEAVLNYQRASLIMPGDGDLESNYAYTKSLLGLLPRDAGNLFLRWFERSAGGLSIDNLSLIAVLFYVAFFVFLSLRLFLPAMSKPLLRLAGAAAILSALIFITVIHQSAYARNCAVVVVKKAEARFEPFEIATAYFNLSEGMLVEIVESSGSWCKIKRPDAKTGWVKKSDVERVVSE